MARKTQWLPLLGLAAAAYAAKVYFVPSDSTDNSDPTDYGLLDSLTTGASDILATITGTKEPSFVAKMQPIADQIQATYGIDPLITVTQSALESGWGLSGLTQKANNLFGFTGDDWAKQGKSVIYMNTHEWSPSSPDKIQYWSAPGDIISKTANPTGGTDLMVKRPFRSYPTWYDSVADWAALMRTSRYATALNYAKAGDLDGFAASVAAAGYATEPDYADQLVSVGTDVSALQNA